MLKCRPVVKKTLGSMGVTKQKDSGEKFSVCSVSFLYIEKCHYLIAEWQPDPRLSTEDDDSNPDGGLWSKSSGHWLVLQGC